MKTLRLSFGVLAFALAVPGFALELQTATANQSPGDTLIPNSTATPVAPATPAAPQSGAGIIAEVTRMVQSGAPPDVIKAYIDSWPSGYVVTADDVLHLHDINAPADVVTTLIRHSAQLEAARTVQGAPTPGTPEGVSTNPPPAVLYPYPGDTGTNPPVVVYPYPPPSYSYPAYNYSYLYPYSLFPYDGYWSHYYMVNPYYFGTPYYRFGYYPHYYGYRYGPGYGHGYYGRFYGGRPYGWGGRGYGGHFGFGHR